MCFTRSTVERSVIGGRARERAVMPQLAWRDAESIEVDHVVGPTSIHDSVSLKTFIALLEERARHVE